MSNSNSKQLQVYKRNNYVRGDGPQGEYAAFKVIFGQLVRRYEMEYSAMQCMTWKDFVWLLRRDFDFGYGDWPILGYIDPEGDKVLCNSNWELQYLFSIIEQTNKRFKLLFKEDGLYFSDSGDDSSDDDDKSI